MDRLRDPRLAPYLQFIRFAIVGGFVTFVSVALYWVAAMPLGMTPLVANGVSYLISVVVGYFLHSLLTFRDPDAQRDVMTTVRFFLSSLVGFALNSFWAWVLTGPIGGPKWWPMIPIALVTPPVTFLLNRIWVFRQG